MEIGTRIIDSAGRIRRRFGRVLLRTVIGTVVVLLRVPIFCRVVVYYWSRCRTSYFILGTHETEKIEIHKCFWHVISQLVLLNLTKSRS